MKFAPVQKNKGLTDVISVEVTLFPRAIYDTKPSDQKG
jgi:hypothetical protein